MFEYARINSRDLSLIAAVLLIFGISAFCIFLLFAGQKSRWVIVEQNGDLLARISLQEERTVSYTCEEGGRHVIEIQDGRVRVREADCPDQICVRQGWLEKPGQLAVCLPHRMVVRIEGGFS